MWLEYIIWQNKDHKTLAKVIQFIEHLQNIFLAHSMFCLNRTVMWDKAAWVAHCFSDSGCCWEISNVTCEHLLCSMCMEAYSMGESWPQRLAECTINCIVFELCLGVLQWCRCLLQTIRCWFKYPPFPFHKHGLVNFISLRCWEPCIVQYWTDL